MGRVSLEAYRVLWKLLVMRGYTWISGNETEKRIYVEHSGGITHRIWSQLGCGMNERGGLEGLRVSVLISWLNDGILDQ